MVATRLLRETEDEESAADRKLTDIAVDDVMPSTTTDADEDGEADAPVKRNGRGGTAAQGAILNL